MGPIDFINRTKRIHVLGPLPAVVIGVRVSDLNENHSRHRRRLQKVVRRPPHRLHRIPQLRSHHPPEVDDAPRQKRRRERHGKPELDVVAGVVVPAAQIPLQQNTKTVNPSKNRNVRTSERANAYSDGGAVVQGGVAAPFEALVGGELAGALAFEEEDAFAEGVVVVVLGGGRR